MAADQPRFKVGDKVRIPSEASVGTIVEVLDDPPIMYIVTLELTAAAGTEHPQEHDEVFSEDDLEPW